LKGTLGACWVPFKPVRLPPSGGFPYSWHSGSTRPGRVVFAGAGPKVFSRSLGCGQSNHLFEVAATLRHIFLIQSQRLIHSCEVIPIAQAPQGYDCEVISRGPSHAGSSDHEQSSWHFHDA
jgi:hypothetical protein